jgi:isoleucyl-tRNA synthetase
MARLAELIEVVRDGYERYQFSRVVNALFDFCNDTMSAVYLAAVKDRLYCDAPGSARRRRTQTVLDDTVRALIRMLAPILVHTADEAWLALAGDGAAPADGSVHQERLPEPFAWAADPGWEAAMALRGEALKQLELAKEAPGIANPLDAGIVATLPADECDRVRPLSAEMADLCGVSRFVLADGAERSVEVVDLRGEPRCERCWKRDGTVRERADGGLLSDRDAAAVGLG